MSSYPTDLCHHCTTAMMLMCYSVVCRRYITAYEFELSCECMPDKHWWRR